MRVNDQQVTFNVLEAMKNPDELEDCQFLSVADFVVADRIDRCCSNKIKKVTIFEGFEEEDVAANQIDWMEGHKSDRHKRIIEHLNLSDREVKTTLSSIDSPHSLELKLLHTPCNHFLYFGCRSRIESSRYAWEIQNSNWMDHGRHQRDKPINMHA